MISVVKCVPEATCISVSIWRIRWCSALRFASDSGKHCWSPKTISTSNRYWVLICICRMKSGEMASTSQRKSCSEYTCRIFCGVLTNMEPSVRVYSLRFERMRLSPAVQIPMVMAPILHGNWKASIFESVLAIRKFRKSGPDTGVPCLSPISARTGMVKQGISGVLSCLVIAVCLQNSDMQI